MQTLSTEDASMTEETVSTNKGGRPPKAFDVSSTKSKNRKVEQLIAEYSLDELEYASHVLRTRSNSGFESHSVNDKCLATSKTLALYMDLDLSERKYTILRHRINNIHPNCLPSLYALRHEKQKIIPVVRATEISAEVDLKSILRRTADGLASLCDLQDGVTNASLVCKWGMDGSSGHSRYKQKFVEDEHSDEFMFLIAFVPLR